MIKQINKCVWAQIWIIKFEVSVVERYANYNIVSTKKRNFVLSITTDLACTYPSGMLHCYVLYCCLQIVSEAHQPLSDPVLEWVFSLVNTSEWVSEQPQPKIAFCNMYLIIKWFSKEQPEQ